MYHDVMDYELTNLQQLCMPRWAFDASPVDIGVIGPPTKLTLQSENEQRSITTRVILFN